MNNLGDFKGNSINLSIMKFAAACLVIFSHAYPVAGTAGGDPLYRLTAGQLTFGGFAVAVFFFASGFFVTKSLVRNPGAGSFWGKRAVRIYPSFIAVMLVTTFLMGPVVSSLSVKDYFTSGVTYRYLEYLLFIPRYSLPGVFETNPISLVNGSLWTLTLEVFCYFALFIVFLVRIPERKWGMPVLTGLFLAAVLFVFGLKPAALYRFHDYLRPAFIFAAGMLFYLFRERIRLGWVPGVLSAAALVVCFRFHFADLAMVLLFPYVLSLAVFARRQLPSFTGRLGDYSYGMYLCGFPVQQTLKYCFPDMGHGSNAVCAIAVSIVFSVFLYHLVELPVNRYVKKKGIL